MRHFIYPQVFQASVVTLVHMFLLCLTNCINHQKSVFQRCEVSNTEFVSLSMTLYVCVIYIVNLENLQYFGLYENKLEGPIPSNIGNRVVF